MIELPEILETTLYVQLVQYSWEQKPSIKVRDFEMDMGMDDDCIICETIMVVDFKAELPKVDVTGKVIESLKYKKQSILANAQVEANQIDEQIQSLLAIEFNGE